MRSRKEQYGLASQTRDMALGKVGDMLSTMVDVLTYDSSGVLNAQISVQYRQMPVPTFFMMRYLSPGKAIERSGRCP